MFKTKKSVKQRLAQIVSVALILLAFLGCEFSPPDQTSPPEPTPENTGVEEAIALLKAIPTLTIDVNQFNSSATPAMMMNMQSNSSEGQETYPGEEIPTGIKAEFDASFNYYQYFLFMEMLNTEIKETNHFKENYKQGEIYTIPADFRPSNALLQSILPPGVSFGKIYLDIEKNDILFNITYNQPLGPDSFLPVNMYTLYNTETEIGASYQEASMSGYGTTVAYDTFAYTQVGEKKTVTLGRTETYTDPDGIEDLKASTEVAIEEKNGYASLLLSGINSHKNFIYFDAESEFRVSNGIPIEHGDSTGNLFLKVGTSFYQVPKIKESSVLNDNHAWTESFIQVSDENGQNKNIAALQSSDIEGLTETYSALYDKHTEKLPADSDYPTPPATNSFDDEIIAIKTLFTTTFGE